MEHQYLTLLDAKAQKALGISEPQTTAMADRVRYGELDNLNHVNNKAYLDWFETARVHHFNRIFAPHYEPDPRPRTVLRNMSVHYIDEVAPGESYVVTAQVTAFRRTSYSLEQQVWAGGKLRTRMQGVIVLLSPSSPDRLPLPQSLRDSLVELEGAKDEA